MPLGIELRYRGVPANALRGLFHGKRSQTGFQCVDKGKRPRCGHDAATAELQSVTPPCPSTQGHVTRATCRTRRDWQPNVQYKYLYSEALQRQVKLHVSTQALKNIDRAGGLDMYLLTDPAAQRGSIVAEELRKVIVQVWPDPGRLCPIDSDKRHVLPLIHSLLAPGVRLQSMLAPAH
jgi:ribosomal protein L28